MPGWLINLTGSSDDELEFVRLYAENGVYGTRFKKPGRNIWERTQAYTIADYALIESGDLVFFFCKRNIYGIGRVLNLEVRDNNYTVLQNYPGSIQPDIFCNNREEFVWPEQFDDNLWSAEQRSERDIRFVIFFEPCPRFFTQGLDMDFVLQSDSKNVLHQIRAFEGRSFIRMGEDETQLLIELFTRQRADAAGYYDYNEKPFRTALERLESSDDFVFNPIPLIERFSADGVFDTEAIMQIAFAYGLRSHSRNFVDTLGHWDYICNQVSASPFKPIRAMEFIDIFGYSFGTLNSRLPRAVINYFIIELKRGNLTEGRTEGRFQKDTGSIAQSLKYVDWVANYRAGGNYSLIKAFLIGSGFSNRIIEFAEEHRIRNYVIPRRPFKSERWEALSLVQYTVDSGEVTLEAVLP